MFLLQWDLFVAMRKGPTGITSGLGSQLPVSHDSTKTKSFKLKHTGGAEWRDNLSASQAEASKATSWHMFFKSPRGYDSILSHLKYYAATATAANVVCGRPMVLMLHTDKASGAQVLVNLWWRPWDEHQFTSIMTYTHLEETQRHAKREAEQYTVNQGLRKAPGEEQLVSLGSIVKVELPAKEMMMWSARATT